MSSGQNVAMIAIEKTNNRGMILATIMALVMVFAGVVVVSSDNTVDADWQMGGDIPAGDQDVAAGVDAVAISNFTITNGATWTVKSGASFTINEGVTVTIEKGATLNIENGAYVEVNGTLEIKEGSHLNNASINAKDVGFFVNGTLDVDKGTMSATLTGDDQTITPPADLTTSGLTYEEATPTDTSSGVTYTIEANDSKGVVTFTGDVSQHPNGQGTLGYWVGVKVSGIANGHYALDWPGTAKSVDIDDGTVTLWVQAGSYNIISMTGDQNYKFVLDTRQVNQDEPIGEVYVNGTISVNSNNKTPATVSDQTIFVGSGATADLNAKFTNTTVTAYQGTTKNPYTTGSVILNTNGTEASNLVFTTITERVNAYVQSWDTYTGEVNTRTTNYILDVSGNVAAGTDIQLNAIQGNAGAYKHLYYLNEDGDDLNGFLMYGIVGVSKTLNIDGKIIGPSNSIMDISGTLNIDGSKESPATIFIHGQVNISGTVAIDSIGGTDPTVISGETNTNTWFVGAKIVIEGTGTMTVADADESFLDDANVSGAAYSDDDKLTLTSLNTALNGAIAAGEGDVYVYGFVLTSGTYKWNYYYIVSEAITIPDNITLNIDGYVLIDEGVTMTIAEGGDVGLASGASGLIIVNGTLMDYEILGFNYGTSVSNSEVNVDAEVKSSDEEGTYDMYTSLKNALAGTPGTIELFGAVDIEGTVTIPEGFIIDQNGMSINILNDSTLVVNGIIVSDDVVIDLADQVTEGGKVTKKAGVLTLNNMIVNPNITYPASNAVTVPGFIANGTIGDYEDQDFLLAPAVAAANSGTLYGITSQGKISYSGTLTFTASEDNEGEVITLNGAESLINTIVVSGFGVDVDAEFTGTIQTAVTAGNSSVAFNKASGYNIRVTENTSGETDVTTMTIAVDGTASGNVTIASGSVTLSGQAKFGEFETTILTIENGATLVLTDGSDLQLENQDDDAKGKYAALVVEGTLEIEENANFGYTESDIDTIVQIIGTVNVAQDTTFAGTVDVDGALNIADEVTVTLSGVMNVKGTTNGAIDFYADSNYLVAYPEATVDAASLQVGDDGASDAYAMVVNINGDAYLTLYGLGTVVVNSFLTNGDFEIEGYESVDGKTWYTDAEYKDKLKENSVLEDTPAVYVKLKPLNASVQVSIGTGMSLYVDGVKMENMLYHSEYGYSMTAVGTHTVEVTLNPGYTGDFTINFNGQVVENGGTITITSAMTGENADTVVLSVSGNITQVAPVTEGGDSGNDGMGLTDILLIVLVVLILVMAIIVALRLMRS